MPRDSVQIRRHRNAPPHGNTHPLRDSFPHHDTKGRAGDNYLIYGEGNQASGAFGSEPGFFFLKPLNTLTNTKTMVAIKAANTPLNQPVIIQPM